MAAPVHGPDCCRQHLSISFNWSNLRATIQNKMPMKPIKFCGCLLFLCYSTFVSVWLLVFYSMRLFMCLLCKKRQALRILGLKMYIIKLFAISFWYAIIPRTLHNQIHVPIMCKRGFSLAQDRCSHVTIRIIFFSSSLQTLQTLQHGKCRNSINYKRKNFAIEWAKRRH